ncbi:hypothetical protein RI103_38765 (plasmid) [Paraburkholderia sp. FT54]|uniref:hypothetical protein n=1 Tax=Paraburkholderia sp. FT54 TaxID=3074437 RepID=UPI002877B68C|nr:hypothetical protein [Paraburkholderia sp. FT54]WNC95230.1 hypothetical protein RI103_38765 [Paraburkholderia sp. FT54]
MSTNNLGNGRGPGFVLVRISYSDLSVTERIGYAEGLVDGLLVSSVLTGSDRNLDMLSGCIYGMTNELVVAIFDKYLRDNPKYWQRASIGRACVFRFGYI